MKLKSNRSASKRFKITKSGKVLARRTRQNHFNAKGSGNTKRRKRVLSRVPAIFEKKEVKKLMPYV